MARWRRDARSDVAAWLERCVDEGRLPGGIALLAHGGEVEWTVRAGHRDAQRTEPYEPDTIVRIYSMTKPVISVAALALIEDGRLGLDDPVARYIPSFGRLHVDRAGGLGDRIDAVPARTSMTVRHLLTHTSGLTYGGGNPGAIARSYEAHRTDFGCADGLLAEICDRLADIPLLFEPGSAWHYGVSSDVLGRVIEVAADLTLDRFIRDRITGPLGMVDTGFDVPERDLDRLAALYEVDDSGTLRMVDATGDDVRDGAVTTWSGGAGLVSTARDYLRFAEMLRQGGSLDGTTIVEAASVAAMVTNRLPADLASFGQESFNETSTVGVGYGFGVSVVIDASRTVWRCAPGEFAWGGYAGTAFWVDSVNALTVILLTQALPSDRYPLRAELRSLVYDAV
jgi:CubicO group peptidase (beta-lactamase class C family)